MKVKINKVIGVITMLVCSCIIIAGCWNYREVEQLAIASGVAVDTNADGTAHITIEVVNIGGGSDVAYEPKYIESDGITFFEAARKAITKEGKKIYWSHCKVVILSEIIAKEEVSKYLDFLYRDAEIREDIWLLISKEKTAGEILQSKGMLKPIVSFQIDDTMRSQKAVSRFPTIQMYEFFDRLIYKQVSAILPTVNLVEQHGEKTPHVGGTAIFKGKKLIGFLNEEDTKGVLWLRDEIEGGLIVLKDAAGTNDNVTLEIFKSKSKITPAVQDGVLKIKVETELDVNIGAILGETDFINSPGRQKLAKAAEDHIKKQIDNAYIKLRDEYKADIFGFGRRVEMKLPDIWNQIKKDWDKFFAELEVDVKVTVNIKGSGATRMPIKIGE
jgi:spore germination protein KC